jgi:hypothetical protein
MLGPLPTRFRRLRARSGVPRANRACANARIEPSEKRPRFGIQAK